MDKWFQLWLVETGLECYASSHLQMFRTRTRTDFSKMINKVSASSAAAAEIRCRTNYWYQCQVVEQNKVSVKCCVKVAWFQLTFFGIFVHNNVNIFKMIRHVTESVTFVDNNWATAKCTADALLLSDSWACFSMTAQVLTVYLFKCSIFTNYKLEIWDRAQRKAARRRKSDWKDNFVCSNSARSNGESK